MIAHEGRNDAAAQLSRASHRAASAQHLRSGPQSTRGRRRGRQPGGTRAARRGPGDGRRLQLRGHRRRRRPDRAARTAYRTPHARLPWLARSCRHGTSRRATPRGQRRSTRAAGSATSAAAVFLVGALGRAMDAMVGPPRNNHAAGQKKAPFRGLREESRSSRSQLGSRGAIIAFGQMRSIHGPARWMSGATPILPLPLSSLGVTRIGPVCVWSIAHWAMST